MAVPKVIQDQIDAANKKMEEATSAQQEVVVEPSVPQPAKGEEQPVIVESVPKPQETTSAVDPEEHRKVVQQLKTLQGTYKSWERKLIAKEEELKELRNQVEELKKTVAPERPAHLKHVKPEELESLDSEVLDVYTRIARGVAEESMMKVSAQPKNPAPEPDDMEDMKDYWDTIESIIPGSIQMDREDKGWHSFLGKRDSITGASYADIGRQAIASRNVDTLVNLINAYKEQSNVQPEPVLKPAQGSIRSEPSSGTRADPTVTREFIKKFYHDKAHGKYRGRETEALKIEEKIKAAVFAA